MAASITGFAYLLLTFGFGFFAWRFFQSWKEVEMVEKKKNEVGKWLFYFFAIFTILCFLATIGGLFFSKNTAVLREVVITTAFILSFGSATAAYLIVYLSFPRVNPWYGFLGVFFLGLITTILTIVIPFEPFLEINGGINWDLRHPVSTLRFSIYLITFLPLSIIFLRQFYLGGEDEDIKIKSLVLTLIFAFGLIIAYVEFILEPALLLPAFTSDILVILLGIVLLGSVLLPLLSIGRQKYKFKI